MSIAYVLARMRIVYPCRTDKFPKYTVKYSPPTLCNRPRIEGPAPDGLCRSWAEALRPRHTPRLLGWGAEERRGIFQSHEAPWPGLSNTGTIRACVECHRRGACTNWQPRRWVSVPDSRTTLCTSIYRPRFQSRSPKKWFSFGVVSFSNSPFLTRGTVIWDILAHYPCIRSLGVRA